MRILAVVRNYPIPFKPYYDTQFTDLVRGGHELQVWSHGPVPGPINEKVRQVGLESRTRTYPSTIRHAVRHLPAILRALVRSSRRAAAAWRVGWRAGLGGSGNWRTRFAAACRAVLVSSTDPEFILIHGTMPGVEFHWVKRLFPDVPVALYYHGGEPPTVEPLDDRLARAAFRSVDAVFTNTRFSRDHAISRGCPPTRIHILPVGFDLDDFRPVPDRVYRRGGKLRLLSAGRMSEEKGFIHALEAVELLIKDSPDVLVEYALTGDGYYRPRLEEFVRERGLDSHVRFLGVLTTNQLLDEMRQADVLLLPSIQVGNWVENQACAVQEAMLLETLVVVSRTGGVPESVAPEFTDFIHDERDPRGLAQSIEAILSLDERQLSEMGRNGRRFVMEHYDIRALNRRMIEMTIEAAR